MNRKKSMRAGVAVDTLFTLTLFIVFAISVLFVMITGVKVYQKTAAENADSGNERIANMYLVSKIRHFDASSGENAILVCRDRNGDSLILREDYDGFLVETRLYCRDGYLCELFYDPAEGFDPALGEKVLAVNSLKIDADHGLLRFSVNGGKQMTVRTCTEPEVIDS